ncbi:MAG: glutathione S-transferase family protein [Motiliproteus sp.]
MSELQLVIGNKNYSSWSLRPWLVLKQLHVEFEEIRIPLFTDNFKQQIRQYSEAEKVPILKTSELTVWDSLSICEYLAEQHPHLWPDHPADRALARSAVAEMHSGFTALRHELPMNCRAQQRSLNYSDAAAADLNRIQSLWQQCKSQSQQPGPWLFGRFGIIDAFFAPVVIRCNAYKIPLSELAQGYLKTQLANPDLQQWIDAGKAESEVIEEEEAGEA